MEYAYVLDCSVTMSWFFKDEEHQKAKKLRDSLLDKEALVPNLWSIEVANVLLQAEKKGRITPFQSSSFTNLLKSMPIQIDTKTHEIAMRRILELAREYSLSVYDACYIELSLRFGCPLATFDKQLRRAAKRAGVPILPSSDNKSTMK